MIVSSRRLLGLAPSLLWWGQVIAESAAISPEDEPLATTIAGTGSIPTGTISDILASALPTPEAVLSAEWQVPNQVISFNRDAFFNYRLDFDSVRQFPGKFGAVLAQTNAKDGELVTTDNSWSVVQLVPCRKDTTCSATTQFEEPRQLDDANSWSSVSWKFQRNAKAEDTEQVRAKLVDQSNFFLCFGTGPSNGVGFTCRTFSEFFTIHPEPSDKDSTGNTGSSVNTNSGGALGDVGQGLDSNPPVLPTGTVGGTLSLNQLPPYVTYSGMPTKLIPTTFVQPSVTLIGTTITASATPGSNPNAPGISTSSPSSGAHKLTTGAIVGIALGTLVIVSLLAVLALFFCVRRRRRAQSGTTHEKAMLTRGPNGNQDIDKDIGPNRLIHPNSNDSNLSAPHDQNPLIPLDATALESNDRGIFHDREPPHDPQTIHHHSRPPPFPAAGASAPPIFGKSSPLRRKPTNASVVSTGGVSALSRNPSSATMLSSSSFDDDPHHHPSPLLQNSRLYNIGEEEGSVRYGESPRHTVTQIFNSNTNSSNRGSGASPFVSEGMSAEEVARLEEEERRIDAAIAAAEAEARSNNLNTQSQGQGQGQGQGNR